MWSLCTHRLQLSAGCATCSALRLRLRVRGSPGLRTRRAHFGHPPKARAQNLLRGAVGCSRWLRFQNPSCRCVHIWFYIKLGIFLYIYFFPLKQIRHLHVSLWWQLSAGAGQVCCGGELLGRSQRTRDCGTSLDLAPWRGPPVLGTFALTLPPSLHLSFFLEGELLGDWRPLDPLVAVFTSREAWEVGACLPPKEEGGQWEPADLGLGDPRRLQVSQSSGSPIASSPGGCTPGGRDAAVGMRDTEAHVPCWVLLS